MGFLAGERETGNSFRKSTEELPTPSVPYVMDDLLPFPSASTSFGAFAEALCPFKTFPYRRTLSHLRNLIPRVSSILLREAEAASSTLRFPRIIIIIIRHHHRRPRSSVRLPSTPDGGVASLVEFLLSTISSSSATL